MKYSAGCELRCVNEGCLLKSSSNNATTKGSAGKMSRVGDVGKTSIQLDGQVKDRQRKGDLIFEQELINVKHQAKGDDVMTETTAATTFSATTTTTPTTVTNGRIRISMGRSMKDREWKWTKPKKYSPRNVKQMIVVNDSQIKTATNQLSSRRQNIKKLCTAYRGLGIQKSFMCYSLKLYKLHG